MQVLGKCNCYKYHSKVNQICDMGLGEKNVFLAKCTQQSNVDFDTSENDEQ